MHAVRKSNNVAIVLVVTIVMAMPSLALANHGYAEMYFDITSNGSDSAIIVELNPLQDTYIPVEVAFTASTDKPDAPWAADENNMGGAGLVFQLKTELPLVDQAPMTLSPQFVNAVNAVSSTPGAGFDSFADEGAPIDSNGDSWKDAIDAVAGFQGPLEPKFKKDLKYAGHNAPIQIATGLIRISGLTPLGVYSLEVVPQAAQVWHLFNYPEGDEIQTAVIPAAGDAISLVLINPEPTTIGLLSIGAAVMFRRRRQMSKQP